jgi:hypothetical protein
MPLKGAVMKKLIVVSLVALMGAAVLATPALAGPDKKTELVALDGKSVAKMPLRDDFDATWVLDTQRILFRDDRRAYYLVTLKEACPSLTIRSLNFSFHPGWSWQLRDDFSYEVRPQAGSPCDVARIEKMDDAKADPLRDAAHHRVW